MIKVSTIIKHPVGIVYLRINSLYCVELHGNISGIINDSVYLRLESILLSLEKENDYL